MPTQGGENVETAAGRKLGGAVRRPGMLATRRMAKEIKDLRARVAELESAMQESRQLSKRLAEVTDIVAEVLLPSEQRDEARLRELLHRYERSMTHM
jgi:DNA repair exonuclease SbcCD ATPase subunit